MPIYWLACHRRTYRIHTTNILLTYAWWGILGSVSPSISGETVQLHWTFLLTPAQEARRMIMSWLRYQRGIMWAHSCSLFPNVWWEYRISFLLPARLLIQDYLSNPCRGYYLLCSLDRVPEDPCHWWRLYVDYRWMLEEPLFRSEILNISWMSAFHRTDDMNERANLKIESWQFGLSTRDSYRIQGDLIL